MNILRKLVVTIASSNSWSITAYRPGIKYFFIFKRNCAFPWTLRYCICNFKWPSIYTRVCPFYKGAYPIYTGACPIYTRVCPFYTGAYPIYTGACPIYTRACLVCKIVFKPSFKDKWKTIIMIFFFFLLKFIIFNCGLSLKVACGFMLQR